MTAEPEYPIISTTDLKVGQQYRHGPWGLWHTFNGARWRGGDPQWVEAKPTPFQVGDRVRYKDDHWSPSEDDPTATVKLAGERWLIVQVDDGGYEDAWAILHTERIEANR